MNAFGKIKAAENTRFYAALILGSVLLLAPAIYNHYPLANPDTATYLASGFKPETPFDRPIIYGLLARLLSLNGLSLWLLVFAQAYLVSWLVFKIIRNLAGGGPYLLKALAITGFLSACTGLSWVVCQVEPDIFTSIGFLCIVLLLMNDENKRGRVLLYILFFIAVATHLSHPLLFSAALLWLFILKKFFTGSGNYKRINKQVAVLVLLSLAGIIIMGPALSKSRHVYLVGSLLEKGVLKRYLDENCAVKQYKLCAYKDQLPAKSDDFIWVASSPFYKIGDWKGTKDEFNDMIRGVFTNPAYLKLFVAATAKQAVQQAITFNTGDGNFCFPPGSNVNQRVAEYFPREINAFNHSKQNTISLQQAFIIPNRLFTTIIILSLATLVWALVYYRRLPDNMRLLLLVCITGIVLNCLDCAAFSVVVGRYGCKMIWLLPFCAAAFMVGAKKGKPKLESRQQ